MSRMKKRRYIATLVMLFVLGVGFFYYGFKSNEEIRYAYSENNSVDYKVYLKENKFFDTPYLEKNKTYITSLIDYIDTDYSYNIYFNENVSGALKYRIIAEIKADKNNNDIGNYWTKTYNLTDEKQDEIKNKNSHSLKINQIIDYNKYDKLMKTFIKEYNLQTEATLKVYLQVKGDVTVVDTDEKMNVDSNISLTVPLSKVAIEGRIETDSKNNEKEIISKANEVAPLRKISRILFAIFAFMFLNGLLKYVRFLRNRNTYLNYRDTIKKINRDYEDIITKVKSMNTNDFAMIDLDSFDDLISVYNSIREPINFLYGNDQSRFFIIKGNTCYMHTIINEELLDE